MTETEDTSKADTSSNFLKNIRKVSFTITKKINRKLMKASGKA